MAWIGADDVSSTSSDVSVGAGGSGSARRVDDASNEPVTSATAWVGSNRVGSRRSG